MSAHETERAAELLRAGAHPLRIRTVELLAESDRPLSTTALARHFQLSLAGTAYHVRLLHSLGAIAPLSGRQRRGAYETFYVLAPAGIRLLHAIAAVREPT